MIYIRAERYYFIRSLVEAKQNRRKVKINTDHRELPLPLSKKEPTQLPVKEIISIAVWMVALVVVYLFINMVGG